MKNNGDLAQQWRKMADEEFVAAETLIQGGVALGGACFHCQQGAEKALKAWLIAHDVEPEKIHKLEQLVTACCQIDSSFGALSEDAESLTKYAVKRRYDADFWPPLDEARSALECARRICDFVKGQWDK